MCHYPCPRTWRYSCAHPEVETAAVCVQPAKGARGHAVWLCQVSVYSRVYSDVSLFLLYTGYTCVSVAEV